MICKYCGKEFEPKTKRKATPVCYTQECRRKYLNERRKVGGTISICQFCGKEFRQRQGGHTIACSDCYPEYRKGYEKEYNREYLKRKRNEDPAWWRKRGEQSQDYANNAPNSKSRIARLEKAKRIEDGVICKNCGKEFMPRTGLVQICDECKKETVRKCRKRVWERIKNDPELMEKNRRRMRVKRLPKRCVYCGEMFIPKNKLSRVCYKLECQRRRVSDNSKRGFLKKGTTYYLEHKNDPLWLAEYNRKRREYYKRKKKGG